MNWTKALAEEDLDALYEILSSEENSANIDFIQYRLQNPIYLKIAIPQDLTELGFFSHTISQKIINLAKDENNFTIAKISDSLCLSKIQRLLLAKCASITPIKAIEFANSTKILAKDFSPKSRAFKESIYSGSSLDYTLKSNIASNFGSLNIINAKDAGEKINNSFTSISYQGAINGLNFILGDYSYSSGLGLIISQSYPSRKSAEALATPVELKNEFSLNRSSMESSFFRGIFINTKCKIETNAIIKSSLFYSSKSLAASYDSNSNTITSLYSAGLYRNDNEISKMNQLKQNIIGLNCEYESIDYNMGLNAIYIANNKEILSQSSNIFSGKNGALISLYSGYRYLNYRFASEIALDAKQNFGAKAGVLIDREIALLSLGARYYEKSFRSSFGSNFGEQGYPANECGVYFGLNLKRFAGGELANYIDVYRTLGSTYLVPAVVYGMDYYSRFDFKLSKFIDAFIKIEYEKKNDSERDSLNNSRIFKKSRYNLALDLLDDSDNRVKTGIKLAMALVDYEGRKNESLNYLGAFKIKYIISDAISFESRIAYGSGDNYDSALWYFYSTAKGSFQSVAFDDKMGLISLKADFELSKYLLLNISASKVFNNTNNFIGAGYDRINSNSIYSFFLQMEWNYRN